MGRVGKWWQRWVLEVVLVRPPPLLAVLFTIFCTVFAVGFWCAHWIDQLDLTAYRTLNVFTDNIKGENFFEKISGILPVDVVYTWVNGSDPLLLEGLQQLSSSSQQRSCQLSHCLPAPYISVSNLSEAERVQVAGLVWVKGSLQQHSVSHNKRLHTFTLIPVSEEAGQVVDRLEELKGILRDSHSLQQAYWTSDVVGGLGVKQPHALLVTRDREDLPHPPALLPSLLPGPSTHQCVLNGSSSVQVLQCEDQAVVASLLQHELLASVSVKLRPAMLMLQLHQDKHSDTKDLNRFEDNEELRYSLRSLEKFAPWVRRVFLVTNGQIPHWLNLDHPRLSLVPHSLIFPDPSHLPSFSSPAIESHIHRIPGLSQHFLYFNDDVMLGAPVWPHDFFSPSSGYKIYLSWSLPECAPGCPGSWLGDGYCDGACNTSACEWDAGDCQAGGANADQDFMDAEDGFSHSLLGFCSPSCSDLWLADKYCDQSCNNAACGFDGGDCGLKNMEQLHQLQPPASSNVSYVLPRGVVAAWMNLSSLVIEGSQVVTGQHSDHTGLRSLAINTAQAAMVLVLKPNVSTILQLQVNISSSHHSTMYWLRIKCNTFAVKRNESSAVWSVPSPAPPVTNFTFAQVSPHVWQQTQHAHQPDGEYALVNEHQSNLPSSVVEDIVHLEARYTSGELTLKGLKTKKSSLLKRFMEGKQHFQLRFYNETEWNRHVNLVYSKTDIHNNSLSVNGTAAETQGKLSHMDKARNEGMQKKLNLSDKKINGIQQVNVSHEDAVVREAGQQAGVRSLLWVDQTQHQRKATKEIRDLQEKKIVDKNDTEKERENGDGGVIKSGAGRGVQGEDGTLRMHRGNLPWEKQAVFPLQEEGGTPLLAPGDYPRLHTGRRALLDMFGESLLHVNRLYNTEYGHQARRVPAHMPHFINKDIMHSLQQRFEEEFELTSSHKIRQANDMQYAFSYFYFVMSEKQTRTPSQVFDEYDTDNSGTLSDREIRTFLARLHQLPLLYHLVTEFHQLVHNCTSSIHPIPVSTPVYERYADSTLPTVSRQLMVQCEPLRSLLDQVAQVNRFPQTHLPDDAVHFKMVTSNVSIMVHRLDEVRKNPRKFICLNSNLEPGSPVNELIHALVQDTYESLFPLPSAFELPVNYRNRFLYVWELVAWRRWRDLIRALIYACLASLISLTLINFYSTEIEALQRRWCRRRQRRNGCGSLHV